MENLNAMIGNTYETDRLRRRLELGDRLFVRVILRGSVAFEFMTDRVADMTELIGEVRHAGYGLAGLGRLQVRNHSRGWGHERPLMFYPPSWPRRESASGNRGRGEQRQSSYSELVSRPGRTMFFPWETH